MTINFEGQVALVTGAGAGIGESTARAFSAAGATVVLVDINGAAATSVAQALVAQACVPAHINATSRRKPRFGR